MHRFSFTALAFGAALGAAALIGSTSAHAEVTPTPNDPAFKAGLADRRAWEEWFASLTGDFKVGAEYGARPRGRVKPGSCYAPDGSSAGDWTQGCLAAQRKLAGSDVRRKAESQYWHGWNSLEPAVQSLMPVATNSDTTVGEPSPNLPTASFDCAKASTRAAQTICSDPEIGAADKEMARQYLLLKDRLSPDQRSGLVRDQQEWVIRRDRGCSERTDFSRCILEVTLYRQRYLSTPSITIANGTTLVPHLFREDSPGIYEISILYPIAEGGNPEVVSRFNELSRYLSIETQSLDMFRSANGFHDVPNTHFAGYSLERLGDNLVSFLFSSEGYSGGAHGFADRFSILFDFAQGRLIDFDSFLIDPTQALPAISQLCTVNLKEKGAREGWGQALWINDPTLLKQFDADPIKEVRQIRNWHFKSYGVDIIFGDYTIGPYVIGIHECTLPYSEIAPWINPNSELAHVAGLNKK